MEGEANELGRATRARIPAAALGALAGLRARPGVRVAVEGDALAPGASVLVEWERGDRLALERILPIEGAALFREEAGAWFRVGSRIPVSPAPDLADPVSLARVLAPRPVVPEPPGPPAARARLALVRDGQPRPASAIRCSLDELVRWGESATSHALARVRAAHAGDQVLLVSSKLPPIAGERFWGRRVLRPLGFATDPDLPEEFLARALGLAEGELALVSESSLEVLDEEVLAPLSRAAVRSARPPRPEARP